MPAYSRPSKQSGAALLVFLLLIIVSAATLLVDRLNAGIRSSIYNPETSVQLEEAKTALISWAVNHPVNPGTLPMPDRNGDGDYDGDSDCYNGGPIGNNLLLGRLPWRDYPSPCTDAGTLTGLQLPSGITSDVGSDRSGRVLWYAVSHNLVYENPEYPFISPAITDKQAGWITVRDSSGTVISDRVAFVVISPGPALSPFANCAGMSYAGQDRSAAAPNIGNYLDSVTIGGTTYSNADYDQDFIMYPNSIATNDDTDQERCDQFNDQLEFVTIDELMDVVSRRALNEAANALSGWHTNYGALPWLSPFSDPKSDPKPLTGQASSASNNLVDNSVDFTELGVAVGDIVWNLTDGSRAAVTNVAATTLTLGNLRFGSDNTFSVDDEYFVERRLDSVMRGTASLGSDSVTLEDTTRDFEGAGILPGDVVDNLSDGSSGVIESVDGDELTVAEMTGGTENDFDFNDQYRIRSNQGRATTNTDSNGLTLEDTNANYTRMDVQVGDLVRNITDGSFGYVSAVNSATQLTVTSLLYGTANAFANNDYYAISRTNPVVNTTSGHLPLHRTGEMFPSGFTVNWNLAGGSITTSLANDSTYTTSLSGYVGASTNSGTITVPMTNSACQWLSDQTVRCKGMYEDSTAAFLAGTATTGSSSLALRDSNKNFSTIGAKRGDKVRNLTDGTTGVVTAATSTQLTLVNVYGSSVGVSVGDNYQIDLATSSLSFSAQSPSTAEASLYRVYYPSTLNESLLEVGDTIENMSLSPSPIGTISSINTASNYIVYTRLQGNSTYDDIYNSETVRIKRDFVSQRQYLFDVTLTGTRVEAGSGGLRTRTVCSGYDSSCTTASNNASFKGDGSTRWITIRDYEGSTQVGQVTNTLSTGGVVSRSLKLGGIQYLISDENGDLPDWFVRNNWHQYVMVAYDNGDAPGGTQCTAGTDCISVNVRNASNDILATRDNVRVVVMLAGNALTGQSWGNATAADYYDEVENTDADELFDRYAESDNYNDVLRIATSCPTDTTKLCWSN